MMSAKPLRSQVVTVVLADIVAKGATFALPYLLVRLLSTTEFAVFSWLQATWGVAMLLQFGGAEVAYPLLRAKHREFSLEGLTRVATQVASVALVVMPLVYVFFVIVSGYWQKGINVKPSTVLLFTISNVALGGSIWAANLARLSLDFDSYARINLASKGVAVGAALLAMLIFIPTGELPSFLIILTLCQTVALGYAQRRLANRLKPPAVDGEQLASPSLVVKTGMLLLPGALAHAAMVNIDRILAGYYLPANDITALSIAALVASGLIVPRAWVVSLLQPRIVEAANRRDNDEIDRLYLTVGATSAGTLFFGGALVAVWGQELMALFFQQNLAAAAHYLPLYLLGVACSSISSPLAMVVVYKSGNASLSVKATATAFVVATIIGLVIIPLKGAVGSAICYLCGEATLLAMWTLAAQRLRIQLFHLQWRECITLGTCSLIMVLAVGELSRYLLTAKIVITVALLTGFVFLNWRRLLAIRATA